MLSYVQRGSPRMAPSSTGRQIAMTLQQRAARGGAIGEYPMQTSEETRTMPTTILKKVIQITAPNVSYTLVQKDGQPLLPPVRVVHVRCRARGSRLEPNSVRTNEGESIKV